MRILFALPGFHKYERGAEVALLSLATELAQGIDDVTVIGSGHQRAGDPYRFVHAGSIRRENFEKFPSFPPMRSETVYEEASFAPGLLRRYLPADYDVTITCSFPFTNMILRRSSLSGKKPLHIYVTQNGQWPAVSNDAEYRLFSCDGLVCTNPDYYEANKSKWNCALIPNGIPIDRFQPGAGAREQFGLPLDRKIVLMASALIPTKRVVEGIHAVASLPDTHLVVAGDGPLRDEVKALSDALLPGRFMRLTVPPAQMPSLYQSADVFLHMSLLESFGNVYPEAMACGLPIVAHDTSRLRWIVGDQEYLVDTKELTAVAAAIASAMKEGGDKKSARHEQAKRFTWSSIAVQYREFFTTLIDNQR